MFRRSKDQTPKNGEEENPFLLSFSDLMASLLAIFILALVVMMIQLHLQKQKLEKDQVSVSDLEAKYKKLIEINMALEKTLENERKRVQEVLQGLLKSLKNIKIAQSEIAAALEGVGQREKSLEGMLKSIQKDLKKQGIEVLVAENGTVLRIPESALSFDSGKDIIPDRYKNSADLIGATLLKALNNNENRKLLDTVFIEGHTDSVPNKEPMGNWGLSTRRAISLWLHWTDDPGRFTKLKILKTTVREEGSIERPLISTSGYADTRPADLAKAGVAHPIEVGNPADRRIDIRFTLASSEKKDLGKLKGQLDSMIEQTDELIKKLDVAK